MTGNWHVVDGDNWTRVILTHDFETRGVFSRFLGLAIGHIITDHNTNHELRDLKHYCGDDSPSGKIKHISIEISAPISDVYEAFRSANLWPHYIPHVRHVDIKPVEASATDSYIQEISMEVESLGRKTEYILSTRVLNEPDAITFNEINPPKPLLHHSGAWVFEELSPNRTRVIASHEYLIDIVLF